MCSASASAGRCWRARWPCSKRAGKRRGAQAIASATYLATMLDYEDPGQIGVYVDKETLAVREPSLMAGERINGQRAGGAFASLRANELVWSFVVNNYLKGKTPPAFDLLYWNSDSSNLPGPMDAYYIRNCYLDNLLREPGKLTMCGVPIDLGAVKAPSYILATREDHIVPWRSAYRSVFLLGGDTEFVLGGSGHIAGVINPAAKNRREFWIEGLQAADPDEWLASAEQKKGSWCRIGVPGCPGFPARNAPLPRCPAIPPTRCSTRPLGDTCSTRREQMEAMKVLAAVSLILNRRTTWHNA
jgi:polyhydroxyalkanoate synthase